MILQILKGRHQHFHSLLYLLDELILLVHSVALVRSEEGAGLANADLAIHAVQLSRLVVLEADFVWLHVFELSIGTLIVLLSEESLARGGLDREGIVGGLCVPLNVEASSSLEHGLLALTALGQEAFEWNGVKIVVRGAAAWEGVLRVLLLLLVLQAQEVELIHLLLLLHDLVERASSRALRRLVGKLVSADVLQLQNSIIDRFHIQRRHAHLARAQVDAQRRILEHSVAIVFQ